MKFWSKKSNLNFTPFKKGLFAGVIYSSLITLFVYIRHGTFYYSLALIALVLIGLITWDRAVKAEAAAEAAIELDKEKQSK